MRYHTRFGSNALFAVRGRWERADAVRRAVICHFGESCAPIRPSIRESSTVVGGRTGGVVGGRRRRWRREQRARDQYLHRRRPRDTIVYIFLPGRRVCCDVVTVATPRRGSFSSSSFTRRVPLHNI